MRACDRYPNLSQFLGGYLHQDWDLDAASADEAVEQAIAGTPRAALPAVADELDELLGSHTDDGALESAVAELCDYRPASDGVTDREWLIRVRRRLRAAG